MRALHFDGSRAAVVDRDEPGPARPGHAIVRTTLAGVCNTDLEIARGYMGFTGTLGHELLGEVVDGPDEWRAERIVSEINFACGDAGCAACAAGLGRHCPTRRVMGILDADGAFAEFVEVPVANLHAVPDGVPDEAAVFAEPLAAAFEIVEQVAIEPGRRAVVFGDGKLGLLAAQVLRCAGADVLAVGRHPEKLAILARRDIETRLTSDFDPAAHGRADLVVEATGSADGIARAIAATRPRGTLVLKTTVAEAPQLDLAPVVIDEIQIVGSRCGPFAPALAALADGSVDVAPLVHGRVPLARGTEALERAAERGVLKVLVEAG